MEREQPISQLLEISLDNIAKLVETGKIIGSPIAIGSDRWIVPIAKLSFGFGAAGSEFGGKRKRGRKYEYREFEQEMGADFLTATPAPLFGGGSGGGVSITPQAFLIIDSDGVELRTLNQKSPGWDKLGDLITKFLNKKD